MNAQARNAGECALMQVTTGPPGLMHVTRATNAAGALVSRDGFAIVRGVFATRECEQIATGVMQALEACTDARVALRRANGALYGARNLFAIYPPAASLWRRPQLVDLLKSVLGPQFGLVRGLYFDKPPEATWSLPWHQDLTIAVRHHSLPSERFRNRTTKAGVPHVEAPDEVLRQMLTLRIHLDDATPDNGPLQVLPGTHIGRDAPATRPPVTVLAAAGDVLAMRPLLSHCSGIAVPNATAHRRVIHLEFAASPVLPDGFTWHDFIPA
jgi:hypothetical protein